jgi:hypothetical protein
MHSDAGDTWHDTRELLHPPEEVRFVPRVIIPERAQRYYVVEVGRRPGIYKS